MSIRIPKYLFANCDPRLGQIWESSDNESQYSIEGFDKDVVIVSEIKDRVSFDKVSGYVRNTDSEDYFETIERWD
jgi:hypothetical protein